jgi:two-component system response regulator AtoC
MSKPTAPSARPGPYHLLVLAADTVAARALAANLRRPGRWEADTCASAEDALRQLGATSWDAVLVEAGTAEAGLELVRRIRAAEPEIPLVVLGTPGVEDAVAAMRAGATDFLPRPPNATAVYAAVERATSARAGADPRAGSTRERGSAETYVRGDHPRLAAIRTFAEQVARVPDARVLITGETGTGKSLLAHAIHELSGAPGRLVEVNCAGLPPQLLESELFGHEAGAFTDARTLKRGLVELADRGTLFLDEIGTMPLELQAKLLLFIERREIRRVGGADTIPVRCRLITATHENLRERVRERSFRQDLLFRLDVASVEMPPLRELPALIPELAGFFTAELAAELGRPAPELDPASLPALAQYPWPGNVRELRNCLERAVLMQRGPVLLPEDLGLTAADALVTSPAPLGPGGALPPIATRTPAVAPLDAVEREHLLQALEAHGWNVSLAARALQVTRDTLRYRMAKHGLQRHER